MFKRTKVCTGVLVALGGALGIGVVEYVADHIVVMKSGRIEEQGACGEVLSRPQREYTRTLLAAVPRLVTA